MAELYVVDDDEGMRRSLTYLLRAAGHLVRTYEGAEEFLQEARLLAPGCVVTDVRMTGMNGLELVRRLRTEALPMSAIVITGHGDVPLAVEAMQAGAVDLLEKPFRDEALLAAVHRALEAGPAVGGEDVRERLAHLSPREQEILASVVLGKTSKMIARELDISPRTVEVHRARLMTKTGAHSLSDLVRLSMQAKG